MVIVLITVKLRPMITENLISQNAIWLCRSGSLLSLLVAHQMYCGICWPMNLFCTDCTAPIWTFPALAVPKGRESKKMTKRDCFCYITNWHTSWTFFVISFHSVPTGFGSIFTECIFSWNRHTRNIGQLWINQNTVWREGTHTQLPLNLNDATTCHKLQAISKYIEIIPSWPKGRMAVWCKQIFICFPICSSKQSQKWQQYELWSIWGPSSFTKSKPSGTFSWSIQFPQRMFCLWTFPTLAGPKRRESRFFDRIWFLISRTDTIFELSLSFHFI